MRVKHPTLGQREEIANLVLFLLGAEPRSSPGSSSRPDGGILERPSFDCRIRERLTVWADVSKGKTDLGCERQVSSCGRTPSTLASWKSLLQHFRKSRNVVQS